MWFIPSIFLKVFFIFYVCNLNTIWPVFFFLIFLSCLLLCEFLKSLVWYLSLILESFQSLFLQIFLLSHSLSAPSVIRIICMSDFLILSTVLGSFVLYIIFVFPFVKFPLTYLHVHWFLLELFWIYWWACQNILHFY